MNEIDVKAITVDDFNAICRVCLQKGENMTDIFKSGIENQLMELTNLKIKIDDKLPRRLCQKCCNWVNQYDIFLELAKASDVFLRSLLPSTSKGDSVVEDNFLRGKKNSSKKYKKKSQRQSKKLKNDSESDKVYLVIVPETGSGDFETDNKIYIKDLNSESDNLELTNYCRTLVKNNFSDHTYPKENNLANDAVEIFKSNLFWDIRDEVNKTHTVNLHIYECNDCKATFEEFNNLTDHFSTHEVEPPFSKRDFNCPVCTFTVGERTSFINHLKAHKEDGFFFVKVNPLGEIMDLKENEKDLFTESFSQYPKDSKIFRISPNSLICSICTQNIRSIESIAYHLESCLCGDKSVIKFNIKYKCPVCCKIFIDEEKNFLKHLSSHREENCYFIKVDSEGELLQVAEEENVFVPYEEAQKISSRRSKIFKIIDVNSCDKCDYSSEFFNELCKHSSDVHFEKMLSEVSFCCPVCLFEFKGANVNENQAKFYEHLKAHKNEGVIFILVKKNGSLSSLKDKYSEIFTKSPFLLSLINSSGLVFENVSPELVILDPKNPSGKYSCDLCQKEFKSKYKVIAHLKSHQVVKRGQDNVNYICEKCGKKCSGKASYKKHFLKHSRVLTSVSRQPLCTICNKKFANRATFDSHMKYHLKEENGNELHMPSSGIICEKCGRSFSNNASLAKHKKKHLKETENTVFKCEICNRDFFRQTSFDRHKSAHLNPKYFECGTCKLPLPSVASLKKHLEIHKNGSNTFDCKACQLSFLSKDSLTAHQTHTGHYIDRKPFECNVCHEKFFIGKKFSQHIKTHPKYKVGECTLCGKRLSTIQSLMLHMGRHFESNTILCPLCGKQFFEERNYHRHLLTHQGIKPFSCDMEGCERSFYTMFELNRHKKYHNNTRDFRCSYCSKSFYEASHLTVHIRTHTGERPYRCPHCNKGFVTRTHCKHHIKLVHQGVGYDLIRSNISKKVAVFEAVEAVP